MSVVKILIDTREQNPLRLEDQGFEVGRVKLPFGDYALKAGDHFYPVFFERKSKADLWGTMTKGHGRFMEEVERTQSSFMSLIILVEDSYKSVLKGYQYSKFKGGSMVKLLATLQVKYGVDTHYFNSRAEMARYVMEMFWALEKNWKVSK